ncbi:MAG TPA: PPC domain-containing DNA-binding protein [Rhizomicrobium sp.]|nr:PPC domain-containing DNA-binding protein [Rhizomicrobium sp.]
MKLSAFLVPAFLLISLPLQAQITRHPATAEDARPNNPKVPDSYAISGRFDRVLVLRMKNKTDLLTEMEKQVKQQNIKNAVILSGIGSLRGYRVHNVASRDYPVADMFTGNPVMPVDLIGMQGYIVNGTIHAHVIMAAGDKAATTISGHLEKGSEVLTFAVVTLGVLNTDLGRVDDATYR